MLQISKQYFCSARTIILEKLLSTQEQQLSM